MNDAVTKALRDLLAALPTCSHCPKIATMGYYSYQPDRCAEHAFLVSMNFRADWADEAEQAQAALAQLEKHEADKAAEQVESQDAHHAWGGG